MMYLAIFSMASSSLDRILGPQWTLKPECRHDKISLATSSVILPFRKSIPRIVLINSPCPYPSSPSTFLGSLTKSQLTQARDVAQWRVAE